MLRFTEVRRPGRRALELEDAHADDAEALRLSGLRVRAGAMISVPGPFIATLIDACPRTY